MKSEQKSMEQDIDWMSKVVRGILKAPHLTQEEKYNILNEIPRPMVPDDLKREFDTLLGKEALVRYNYEYGTEQYESHMEKERDKAAKHGKKKTD